MTDFELLVTRSASDLPDTYVVGLFSSAVARSTFGALDVQLGTNLMNLLKRTSFRGPLGEATTLYVASASSNEMLSRVVVVGMGDEPKEATWQQSERLLRDVAMYAAPLLAGSQLVDASFASGNPMSGSSVRAFAEGLVLGSYQCPRVGREPEPVTLPPSRVRVWIGDGTSDDITKQFARGVVVARRTNWVRDLVSTPSSALGPEDLANIIGAEASRLGVNFSIWSSEELEKKHFGGVLGVGQGSSRPPCVVELRWGDASSATVALTGKGITFDSGGLNLKRTNEIAWMKSDMASAASVAGAVFVAAELDLHVSLHALLPLAENMPSGTSIRPGDVLHHPEGFTTEVTNTDCEGRLVLADCLAYLASTQPACLIDVGTLTDAAGLGTSFWAAIGNDQPLVDELLAAGADSGDRAWQLPLLEEYRELLSSPVADVVNCSQKSPDSTVLAGTYLGMFVGECPWVHVDNGSSAWLEQSVGSWPDGATGSPIRALVRFLESKAGTSDETEASGGASASDVDQTLRRSATERELP